MPTVSIDQSTVDRLIEHLLPLSLYYDIIARVMIRARNLVALKIEGARVSCPFRYLTSGE